MVYMRGHPLDFDEWEPTAPRDGAMPTCTPISSVPNTELMVVTRGADPAGLSRHATEP